MTPRIRLYVLRAKKKIRLRKMALKDNKSVGVLSGKASIKEDDTPLGSNPFYGHNLRARHSR